MKSARDVIHTVERRRHDRVSLLTAVFFVLLAAMLLLRAFLSETAGDEAFYCSIPQRLSMGDRLIVDEWHPTQLGSVFLLAPYLLFVRLTGGTEGIVLYMRFLFILADLAVFAFLARRAKTVFDALASFCFCCVPCLQIEALSYYNLFAYFTLFLGVLLFLRENRSRGAMLAAGVLTGCAVLCFPSFAVPFLVFSAVFLCRTLIARGRPLRRPSAGAGASACGSFGGREFLWLWIGVALSAACFCAYLFSTAGVREVVSSLPNLFSDRNHQFSLLGAASNRMKLSGLADSYGLIVLSADAVLIAAALINKRKRSLALKTTVLAACFLVYLFSVVRRSAHVFLDGQTTYFEYAFLFDGVQVLIFAFTARLLCARPAPGVSRFLFFTALCSLSVDLVSNAYLGFGGKTAYFPAVYFAVTVCREVKEAYGEQRLEKQDRKEQKTRGGKNGGASVRRIAVRGLSCLLAVFLIFESGRLFLKTGGQSVIGGLLADPGTVAAVGRGPNRGESYHIEDVQTYEAVLSDLDRVKQNCRGPVFIASIETIFGYLYLGLPYGANTSYYDGDDMETQEKYWRLKPEKRPQYIYVPTLPEGNESDGAHVAERTMQKLERLCDFDREKGGAGWILRVVRWKL
ncbi:MAG: hypothetical protein IJL26_05090 [Clostridia bacterium]|nr:hypothetical protein [Clostridia bacterium]